MRRVEWFGKPLRVAVGARSAATGVNEYRTAVYDPCLMD